MTDTARTTPSQEYSYYPLSTSENDPHSGSTVPRVDDSKWKWIWRATNLLMSIFFVLAAYVQINDPDPYIWIPVYLIPALFTLSITITPKITDNKVWKVAIIIHIAISIAGAMYLLAVVIEMLSLNLSNPLQHEEGRELSGLVIVIIWLTLCRFSPLGSNEPGRGSMNALILLTGTLGTIPLIFWSLCFISDWHKRIGHCKDMFPDWK
ncbi:transmembrane protein 220-like isoform X2 [Tubulanus polymorphus]|uniref:transmembrane protein 220-like isoform X2 n=1 Tax=Tubulanus polymorphus TaxID=672921 RepID=UPI003DA27AFB